jgi:hypothetical protein
MSVAASGLAGVIEAVPGLSEVVVGIAVGTFIGKLVIRNRERRGGELSAMRIRELEARWIGTCVAGALAAGIVVAVILK